MKAFRALLSAFQLFSVSAFGAVTLLWDRNPTNENVTGYKVGYGSASGSYTVTNVGDVTEARIMASGQTFLAVLAYDASGLESGWSSEVVFTPGGTPQFYLGIQPVTMIATSAPPASFTPVPGYQITAEMRRFVGGPVVASVRLFVEEGGTGFATMRAIATNDVPKSGTFTVAKRVPKRWGETPSNPNQVSPPAPAPQSVAPPSVQSSKFRVQSSKFLPAKPSKGGGR